MNELNVLLRLTAGNYQLGFDDTCDGSMDAFGIIFSMTTEHDYDLFYTDFVEDRRPAEFGSRR